MTAPLPMYDEKGHRQHHPKPFLRPLLDAVRDVVRDIPTEAARAVQDALAAQRWADLHDVVWCGSCGGLGVVTDYTNRFYQCPPGECTKEPGEVFAELGEYCEDCPMVYGGKVCPECGGSGSR